ncbi:hypothetical protein HHK36_014052 [Tetracentron sinense]|uniref:Nudix hydrolase domain-containing protein n=1 Tax=Tetracentron sinense TaxID=13715 RepID=A0A834Z7C0_TETSI|nr:hypothetical protein HHK36_014052 [Tetracentron sinense]
MIMPAQKYRDATSKDVKSSFLLLRHRQTLFPEACFPAASPGRLGFGRDVRNGNGHTNCPRVGTWERIDGLEKPKSWLNSSAHSPTGAFMACNPRLCHRIPNSFASLCKSSLSSSSNRNPRLSSYVNPIRFRSRSVMACSFSWDDVSRISQADDALDDPSDLQAYFEKIRICNRGSEMQSEFLPFVIEEQTAGYIHYRSSRQVRAGRVHDQLGWLSTRYALNGHTLHSGRVRATALDGYMLPLWMGTRYTLDGYVLPLWMGLVDEQMSGLGVENAIRSSRRVRAGHVHDRLGWLSTRYALDGHSLLSGWAHTMLWTDTHYCPGSYADHLRKFQDVFIFPQDKSYDSHFGGCVTLHPSLRSPEDRTGAVKYVIKCLGEEFIPGIRNELYPVTSSLGAPVFFSLERAAAPYFGIKAYGVHMNGYVDKDGQKFLWIGKRSQVKPTYPGMLDHLVAGGLPHGITCKENLLKECEEEAGIPRSISEKYVSSAMVPLWFNLFSIFSVTCYSWDALQKLNLNRNSLMGWKCLFHRAIPVGAVSYMEMEGYRYKRDVLFCYDLKLPDGFIPQNQEFDLCTFYWPNSHATDGEVESFKLIPVMHVANIIRRTQFFKPNCSLVIIDFLFRHGYISPENFGYLRLLQSLRNGDCS